MDMSKKDSPLSSMIHRMEDAVGGLAGRAEASSAAHAPLDFLREAWLANLYQVEATALALNRSRSADMRALAEMLARDHAASQAQLRLEAERMMADIQPPQGLDARRQTMIEHLRDAAVDRFDATFLDQQKAAHKEALTLFDGFANDPSNPSLLIAYAQAQLPILRQHQAQLHAAASTSAGPGDGRPATGPGRADP
jgi:putative membrane protein